MTFQISRHGREFYDQRIITDPPVAAWEASFDAGTTWHAAQALTGDDAGWYRWLIAGDRADQGTAVAVLTVGDHHPLGRAAGNPEIVVRDLEPIHVD